MSQVAVFGSVMEYTMQCGATESLCAAANIFLGQSESPLLIAPFLPGASMSELHAIMTAGNLLVGSFKKVLMKSHDCRYSSLYICSKYCLAWIPRFRDARDHCTAGLLILLL